MGKFAKYLGRTKITVDGNELELDVRLSDIEALLGLQLQGVNETTSAKMSAIFLNILRKSYPNEPSEELENMLRANFYEFMTELYIYYKWMNRDDLNKKKEELISSSLKNKSF